jgi:hypothetical protein
MVSDLKLSIAKQHNIPVELQRLIFTGRELELSASLRSYGITDGSVIQVVVRHPRNNDAELAVMIQQQEREIAGQDGNVVLGFNAQAGYPDPAGDEMGLYMRAVNSDIVRRERGQMNNSAAVTASNHSQTASILIMIDTVMLFLMLSTSVPWRFFVVLIAISTFPAVGYIGTKFYRQPLLAPYTIYLVANCVFRIYVWATEFKAAPQSHVVLSVAAVLLEVVFVVFFLKFSRTISSVPIVDLELMRIGKHPIQNGLPIQE